MLQLVSCIYKPDTFLLVLFLLSLLKCPTNFLSLPPKVFFFFLFVCSFPFHTVYLVILLPLLHLHQLRLSSWFLFGSLLFNYMVLMQTLSLLYFYFFLFFFILNLGQETPIVNLLCEKPILTLKNKKK